LVLKNGNGNSAGVQAVKQTGTAGPTEISNRPGVGINLLKWAGTGQKVKGSSWDEKFVAVHRSV